MGAPILLGTGENFFAGLDSPALRYAGFDRVSTPDSIHLIVTKQQRGIEVTQKISPTLSDLPGYVRPKAAIGSSNRV